MASKRLERRHKCGHMGATVSECLIKNDGKWWILGSFEPRTGQGLAKSFAPGVISRASSAAISDTRAPGVTYTCDESVLVRLYIALLYLCFLDAFNLLI